MLQAVARCTPRRHTGHGGPPSSRRTSAPGRRHAWRSAPGRLLAGSTAAVLVLALALPYLPFAHLLAFAPPPPALMLAIVGIAAAYVLASEQAKTWFYRPSRPAR